MVECDGRPIGYALYYYKYSSYRGGLILYMEDLYVKPEFRGSGVGEEILTKIINIATERNCLKLQWMAFTWNQLAIDFYHKFGAKIVTEDKYHIFDFEF